MKMMDNMKSLAYRKQDLRNCYTAFFIFPDRKHLVQT